MLPSPQIQRIESEALPVETPVAVVPFRTKLPAAVTAGHGTVVKLMVALGLIRFVVQLSLTKTA